MSESIIRPDVGCESFEVGGVVYTRTESLCLGRARWLQRYQTELQFGMEIATVQKGMAEIAAFFRVNNVLDGMSRFKQLMDSTDLLATNRFRQADVCALFYNAPDEDPAGADDTVFKKKITAWGAVDAAFFIKTAYSLLADFWLASQLAPSQNSDLTPMESPPPTPGH